MTFDRILVPLNKQHTKVSIIHAAKTGRKAKQHNETNDCLGIKIISHRALNYIQSINFYDGNAAVFVPTYCSWSSLSMVIKKIYNLWKYYTFYRCFEETKNYKCFTSTVYPQARHYVLCLNTVINLTSCNSKTPRVQVSTFL